MEDKKPPYISDDFQIGPDGAYEHESKDFSAYLRTIEQIQEEMVEVVARREFEKVGDEGLFPNHTDMDIWVSGFVAAVNYIKDTTNKLI